MYPLNTSLFASDDDLACFFSENCLILSSSIFCTHSTYIYLRVNVLQSTSCQLFVVSLTSNTSSSAGKNIGKCYCHSFTCDKIKFTVSFVTKFVMFFIFRHPHKFFPYCHSHYTIFNVPYITTLTKMKNDFLLLIMNLINSLFINTRPVANGE